MATVEREHHALDTSYINGMEDMRDIIKRIYELDRIERKKYYHGIDIARIIDRFDFSQLREIDSRIAAEEIKEIKKYYVIRGIKETIGRKTVVAESMRHSYPPDAVTIEAFLMTHKDVDFVSIEEIYTRE